MEAAAYIVGASVLIVTLRFALIWGLCKMADRSGRSVKISGLNPLAVQVEYGVVMADDSTEETDTAPRPARLNGRRRRAIGS